MTAWLMTHVLAAIALAGVAYRLAMVPSGERGWRCAVWTAAHLFIGIGLLAHLLGLHGLTMPVLTCGMALHFGFRWRTRRGDR